MATIRKHFKKWQVLVRKKNIAVTKSFWKKSDASKWAYRTEAQIETGSYKRVKDAEKLADIKLKEVLSTYYEKYLRIKSKDPQKEKYPSRDSFGFHDAPMSQCSSYRPRRARQLWPLKCSADLVLHYYRGNLDFAQSLRWNGRGQTVLALTVTLRLKLGLKV